MIFAQVDFWDLAWVIVYMAVVGYLGWLGPVSSQLKWRW